MTIPESDNTKIQLSIVMVVRNEAEALEQNLPLFLSQGCDIPYEVIVVDDASSDSTPDILKEMKSKFPNLHTTFFPQSVTNPSRLQLALYVGIKAAKSNTIVMADINRPPTSPAWIEGLGNEMSSPSTEVALVYSGRKNPEELTFQSFTQLEEAEPLLLKAERRSGMGHRGSHMKLKRGIYDAVAVSRSRIYDAVKLCDRPVKFVQLLGLRLQVFFLNLTA